MDSSRDALRHNCEYAAQAIEDIVKSGDNERFIDWVADVLDERYSLNGELRYIAVRLTLTCGGPNIYLDTDTGEIEGFWGTDHYAVPVSDDVIAAVDEWYEDIFDALR